MKKKVLEYIAAIGTIALIAGILWLIMTAITKPRPEIGEVTVTSGSATIKPYCNQIYVTEKKVRTNAKRLVPEEIVGKLDYIEYTEDIKMNYDGKSQNGGFYFTVYDEDLNIYEDKKAFYTPLTEPGIYIICIECYWGNENDNIGTEYYFGTYVEDEDSAEGDSILDKLREKLPSVGINKDD